MSFHAICSVPVISLKHFPLVFRETAATLEAESGFSYETNRVADFRRSVLEGDWINAERSLVTLGVRDTDSLRVCSLFFFLLLSGF